jgi:hypothetical protein
MAVGANGSDKGVLVFRPNGFLTTGYTALGAQQQATAGDPTAQVISISAASVPLIAFCGVVMEDFSTRSFSWTPGSPTQFAITPFSEMRYLPVAASPANQTVNEADTGIYTGLMSWYITAT